MGRFASSDSSHKKKTNQEKKRKREKEKKIASRQLGFRSFRRPTQALRRASGARRGSPGAAEAGYREFWPVVCKPQRAIEARRSVCFWHGSAGDAKRPVRRVSGIAVEGVERHGCRERRDGPWMALRAVPLERQLRERTPAQPGPYAGASVFGYFFGVWKK